jgi:hypothetical protein
MGAVVTFPRNETALADARATLRRETVSPEELRAACNTLLLLGSPTDVELAHIQMKARIEAVQAESARLRQEIAARRASTQYYMAPEKPRRVYLSDALIVAGFFAALWLMLAVTQ